MREFKGYKKGVDLGGWLSQCGKDNYTKERFENFIKETDIEKIASWGADHVRLPVDYNVVQNEDGSFKEEGFAYIGRCIEWCEKYDLNMVLDIHKALGYVFDDKNYCQFFTDEKMQDIFVALWEELIRRYGKYHERIAFELLNEITERSMAEKWNEIAARTIKAIRAINTDAKIVIGGIFNSSIFGLTLLEKPADENVVFTFHCYSPLIFTHQAAYWIENMPADFKISYPLTIGEYLERSREMIGPDFDSEFKGDMSKLIDSSYFDDIFAQAVEVAEKWNVPLYCGEYGVIDKADPEDAVRWFKDINSAFEKYGIARAVWSYKEMDFGLIDEHNEKILPELVKYL